MKPKIYKSIYTRTIILFSVLQVLNTFAELNDILASALKEARTSNAKVAIVHGCNCFANNNKGLAATIKKQFPEADKADRNFKIPKGSNRLGKYSYAEVTKDGTTFTIINAYTQLNKRAPDDPQELVQNIGDAFRTIANDFKGYTILYPKIGCGLAGGNWEDIKRIIDDKLSGFNHRVITFEKKKDSFKQSDKFHATLDTKKNQKNQPLTDRKSCPTVAQTAAIIGIPAIIAAIGITYYCHKKSLKKNIAV